MAETITIDRPRSRKPATVSASASALHLDCSRAYIGKLEAEGVIQRHGDGFPLDQSRIAYLRYLRRERGGSRSAVRPMLPTSPSRPRCCNCGWQKKRELVRREDVDELIDEICGVTLTHLSCWPARIAGADLCLRRKAEAVLRQLRIEISEAATKLADEHGEPPLDQQD